VTHFGIRNLTDLHRYLHRFSRLLERAFGYDDRTGILIPRSATNTAREPRARTSKILP
jgi:hypothetical protein